MWEQAAAATSTNFAADLRTLEAACKRVLPALKPRAAAVTRAIAAPFAKAAAAKLRQIHTPQPSRAVDRLAKLQAEVDANEAARRHAAAGGGEAGEAGGGAAGGSAPTDDGDAAPVKPSWQPVLTFPRVQQSHGHVLAAASKR